MLWYLEPPGIVQLCARLKVRPRCDLCLCLCEEFVKNTYVRTCAAQERYQERFQEINSGARRRRTLPVTKQRKAAVWLCRLCAGFGLAIFRMAGALIGALDVFSTCIGKCCFGDQTIFTGPCLVYARTS